MTEVHFYKIDSGECPVENFLNTLTGKQAQKIVWILQLLKETPIPPIQYFQKLPNTDDIWEIGVHLGNDILRILGFEDEQRFVLNHAFQNPTQKHQIQEEIKIAEARKRDYFILKQKTS